MRNILLVLFIALLHSAGFAQKHLALEADSLTIKEINVLKEKIIVTDEDTLLSDTFFNKWKQASEEYARSHSNPMIDSIYMKMYMHLKDTVENGDNGYSYETEEEAMQKRAIRNNCKYMLLPINVNVCVYDNVVQDCGTYYWGSDDKLVDKRCYVPHITSDKPILYDFPTIHEDLEKYLCKTNDKEQIKKRRGILQQYMQVERQHWNDKWYFVTMPFFTTIDIYRNGIIIYCRTSWCQGGSFFLPNGSEKIIDLGDWIE